ncbi:MAG: DUF1045 domain-containing protein [Rhodomicrobium sp.]
MTARFQRYAIYWTPELGSDLALFGERWFREPAEMSGLRADLACRCVKAPARCGLHATLKAPFPLRPGASARDLQQALDAFCAIRCAPSGGALTPALFQGYSGLVLSGQTADIDWLAAECVTHFDSFRAPAGTSGVPADGELSQQEEAFAKEFGYPYVLAAFQFHVTLAGPLGEPELNEVAAALKPHLAPFLRKAITIDCLSLLGERADNRVFELVSRHPFRGGTCSP